MAANDSSNKNELTIASGVPLNWIPDLPNVRCRRCGDQSIGPWIPMGHQTFICENCWDEMLEYGARITDVPTIPLF